MADSERTSWTNNGPAATLEPSNGSNNYVPRPKRIACIVCRRRKLKCDSQRPSCGSCSRLGHDCAYDEVRKKSGPKRGYVKQLEARLAHVETLLRNQEPNVVQMQPAQTRENVSFAPMQSESITPGLLDIPDLPILNGMENPMLQIPEATESHQLNQTCMPGQSFTNEFQWEMIGLGLEEPLPTQDIIDELHQIYFDKVHHFMPIVHRPRYLMTVNLAPNLRPPACLRYIMWCHAAMASDKYSFLHEEFYRRARKYAEMDEMKGYGESIISTAHCQCLLLIGTYEFKRMFFPRAWLSVGKAARLALMMSFNRIDAPDHDGKQCSSPPRDFSEKEERRRVFWLSYCADRYASIGTGWPMIIDEKDIMVNLPASEEAFMQNKPESTPRLADALLGDGISSLSSIGGVVLMASLLGRNLSHLHRPDEQDREHDLNGEFWKRHRAYDNILLNIALSLPSHLRLPAGIGDPNVIFCNLGLHTATICLHQAAIFKAEKNKLPGQIITESKRRCIVAADQTSSLLKMICHTDLSGINPFMAFCIYASARVFIQYLRSRPHDLTARSSLEFIVNILNALKRKNPLSESFLTQLDVDMEGIGFQIPGLTRTPPVTSVVCNSPLNVPDSSRFTVSDPSSSSLFTDSLPLDITSTNPSGGSHPLSTVPMPEQAQYLNPMAPQNSNPIAGSAHLTHSSSPGGAREMDLSAEPRTGERSNNSPSDNPTPSTLNSSSNTNTPPSISRCNQASASSSSGAGHNSRSPTRLPSEDYNNTFNFMKVPCVNGLAKSRLTKTPSSTTASETDLPVLSAWDSLSTPIPDLGNIDTPDAATEAQWAQILSGSDWESWRG